MTFRGSFNRLHNPRTEAHIELDWTQQYVSGSLPTRKQQDKLDYLLGFQPKPVVSLSMPGYMEVKDWVRESTKTVERLADDERLLLMHSNDVVDEFIVCFREANTNGTTRIRNGAAQPIRLGESEGVVRSIHALTYYDRTQLFKTLGLEYDLKYWKIADPLDSINNIIICGYLKTKVKLFFVNLPESIAPILTCLGSDLYRIARLPTSKANSQNTNLVVCETGNSFHTEIIVFALHCENQYSRDNFLKAIPLIHTLQIDLDNALAKLEELQHCLHPNSKFITYIADLLLGCTEWSHLPQHVISVKQSGFKLPSVEQLTTAKKATPLEIPRKSEFVPNREMIILGLQALHRERVTASQSFARYMDGKDSLSLPSMSFGVDEVLGALKEMGEVP